METGLKFGKQEDILVSGAQGRSLLAAEQLTREPLVMFFVFRLGGKSCCRVFQQKHFVVNSAGNSCPCIWHARVGLDHTLK